MPIARDELIIALDELLQPAAFRDYCPNGLQVEGSDTVGRLVSGVTASQALIDAAVAWQADAILVHHGFFWKSEDPCIRGMKGNRIRSLIKADINLIAYHLPLDCHVTLGNNAGLGRVLGLQSFGPVNASEPTLPLFSGEFPLPVDQGELVNRLSAALGRTVLTEGDQTDVRKVVWCTGGGQNYIDHAADLGADLFITGEVSEQTIHVARERNIGFIAAGHHATERFGARSVGDWLAARFDIRHRFIDIDNPA